MPHCCIPRCKSSSKQRTPGISFHEIPSDLELRAKWLKVISLDDWTPNTTSCYSTPKRRAVESQLESPSLPLNDLPSVDVASQELSPMDCSATELPLPLENGARERCITKTVQVSSLFSVSAMDKRKWRRKKRDLNTRIERLKNTVDKYKQELHVKQRLLYHKQRDAFIGEVD
ncbi:hypothetical protein HPB49_020307 [Dermacentor silvarum]|uniref:Uncharacterized protein n=1 Tax=Dermacentor silvarum TaxID=543639 RepID=A0ACB8CMN3_DERSI|nr:hypothetical protein HPB49_020307 [Dermacentor silvarum]